MVNESPPGDFCCNLRPLMVFWSVTFVFMFITPLVGSAKKPVSYKAVTDSQFVTSSLESCVTPTSVIFKLETVLENACVVGDGVAIVGDTLGVSVGTMLGLWLNVGVTDETRVGGDNGDCEAVADGADEGNRV